MYNNHRRASIIIVVIALVAALVLMATLFLLEIHGQQGSSQAYLRRSLTRFAADAGLVHAMAVADRQLLSEATKGATTKASPLYRAFRPLKGGSDDIPGVGDSSNFRHIFIDMAGWADPWKGKPVINKLGAQPVMYRRPSASYIKDGRYTRFIVHSYYDQHLQPVSDPTKAFYLARYDVLPLNIDCLLSVRPDFGPDAYKDPADSSVFALQDSAMLGSVGTSLTSGSPELERRRSIREQYRHMFARSIASVIATEPETSYDGRRGKLMWAEVEEVHDDGTKKYFRAKPGSDFWFDGSRVYSGDALGRLQHLVVDPWHSTSVERSERWYDAVRNKRYNYSLDASRNVADLFMGAGLTRGRNRKLFYNPKPDLTVMHDAPQWRDDSEDIRRRGGTVVAAAAEQPFTPRMVWNEYLKYGRNQIATKAAQYPPFGSGIIDHDPQVDGETMDVGGVPWEINPLTAPKITLRRMVLGLSTQLLYANGSFGGGATKNATLPVQRVGSGYAPLGRNDPDFLSCKVYGYRLGGVNNPGNRTLELLWDPPRPNGSDHSFASTISTKYGSDPEWESTAFAALHPFYDATLTAGSDPIHSQETAEQLYDYLDGLRKADGTANASMDPQDRFLNRLRYVRWVSWKHEICSASAIEEQRMQEVDAPLNYEEGLRYYRRPDRRDLRMDVGAVSRREPFDGSAKYKGVAVDRAHPAGTPGVQGRVSSRKERQRENRHGIYKHDLFITGSSRKDGTPRYRIFPHTYPGPMWTGREGRWEEDAAGPWTCPRAGRTGIGAGTAETFWMFNSKNPRWLKDRLKELFWGEIRPNSTRGFDDNGKRLTREWATDAFMWDIAMAAYESLAVARETGASEYTSGNVNVTVEDIDRRLVENLGVTGGATYSFAANLPVVGLYNPAEPVDVDGDGLYDPAGADRVSIDADGDGSAEMVPAVRDPKYIYQQYNRYWPVRDPLIPSPIHDPALGARPIATVRDEANGVTTAASIGTWKLGVDYAEIQTFTGDDFYYYHPRNLVLAAMVLNDVRQSLLGAGEPQTMARFKAIAAAEVPAVGQMDVTGAAGNRVFVAGRNQDPTSTTPRPFSRTGRLVIKRDRFWRIMVRGQLINLTQDKADWHKNREEILLDTVYCSDPNEDGDPSDGRLLFRAEKTSSHRVKRW